MTAATKSAAPFAVKALDETARTFTGLASTWDLDLGGDVIHRGAFTDTLKSWAASGKIMPLLDSHQSNSVRSVVGKMVSAKETPQGLEATFEVMEGPDGDEVYRRIKGGYVDGLSIGYEPKVWEKPEEEQRKAGVWRILKAVELMEVSVVMWPMNTGARIADVKAQVDRINPDTMSEDEYRIARVVASQIGALLRHAPKPEAEEAKADATPPEEKTSEKEPEAPPSEEADAKEGKKDGAPLYVQEAILERLERINANRDKGKN